MINKIDNQPIIFDVICGLLRSVQAKIKVMATVR